MKKFLALALCLVMMLGCVAAADGIPADEIKVGVILLHDENVGYDYAHILGLDYMKETLGLSDDQVITEYNIPESEECYDAALRLVSKGCNIVFADSFGHEDYLLQAAEENPDVEFCHATGYQAALTGTENLHNFMPSVYESRYVSGVVAGMKLAEVYGADTDAKIGYVGAFSYAEVVSGYTAFFLGVRSVCPNVTMEVKYTGSWADQAVEREVAQALLEDGCVLISQHADSMGAPTACETAGVPNVSYNGSTVKDCPDSFIISSAINWAPYYYYIIKSVVDGTAIDKNWTGTISTGSVILSGLNNKVAAKGTADEIRKVAAELKAGTRHVFDTSKFTVDGKTLTSYKADVDTDDDNTPDTEVVSNGYFHESEKRSAPYFDIDIDGITLLNK